LLVIDSSTATAAVGSSEADALIEQRNRSRTLEAEASPVFAQR
jgi:hypothetical protein